MADESCHRCTATTTCLLVERRAPLIWESIATPPQKAATASKMMTCWLGRQAVPLLPLAAVAN